VAETRTGGAPHLAAHLRRLFAHAAWADRLALDALAAAPEASRAGPLRLLAHVLAAERVWLLRLRGEDSTVQPIWPELGLEACAALAADNAAAYARYLDALTVEAAAREVAYANSQGASFSTRVSDVLTHVALHGAYHRGQVASALRAAGAEPVNTDFIAFVREGY
jgi:uncharacterized damage-inducible protein DinB